MQSLSFPLAFQSNKHHKTPKNKNYRYYKLIFVNIVIKGKC